MDDTNIVKEYFDAQGDMDIIKVIDKISETLRTNTNLCIRFCGLDYYDFWFDAEEILDSGGLQDYLISILDEPTAVELLNQEYEIVDTDDGLTDWLFGRYGTFDWTGYKEALEILNNSRMDDDAFVAGLQLGIPPDKIEDAYQGEFKNDTIYAEEYISESMSIPEHLIAYIDWEAIARDHMDDFNEQDHHYFTTHY